MKSSYASRTHLSDETELGPRLSFFWSLCGTNSRLGSVTRLAAEKFRTPAQTLNNQETQ